MKNKIIRSITPTIFNRLSNIALASSLVVFGAIGWFAFTHKGSAAHAASGVFHVDDRAPAIAGVDYASAERTLIVFASTRCNYCISSVPFFNRLKTTAEERRKNRSVVLVFSEPEDLVARFRNKYGLTASSVPGMNFGNLGVHTTPTMVLVGKAGKITHTWGGTSESVEAEVWHAMGL